MLLIMGAIIVIMVLRISCLQLPVPHLDYLRPEIIAWISSKTGVAVKVGHLLGRWDSFGPTLVIDSLQSDSPVAHWQAKRITISLDIWQSLLHARWQFNDLTFHRMHLTMNTMITRQWANGSLIKTDRLSTFFLQQFNHFNLRDSCLSFLTPSGDRAELCIPKLTWLNQNNRHRAEAQVNLSSFNGQHSVVQVLVDLQDAQGPVKDGTVYLQADNIDVKPWISQWLKNNTVLESANVNLATWLQVRNGELYATDVFLAQGIATWKKGDIMHRLIANDAVLHIARQDEGWQVTVPVLNLKTDGIAWPKGRLAAGWIPASSGAQQEVLRVRASKLSLARLHELLPFLSTIIPDLITCWEALQPEGLLTELSIDIPLKKPEKSCFQVAWHDLRWQAWHWFLGGEKVSGTLIGSIERGRVTFSLPKSVLQSGNQFRAPFEIQQASGAVDWRHTNDGWEVWSNGLNVQARALQIQGDFQYRYTVCEEPCLDILAGIRLTNASDAWRYFPEPLMSKKLVKYLNNALKGGYVDNATLIFSGNPLRFPFENNEGEFQLWVPLRSATFEFASGWPALSSLDINLNFSKNSLWMSAPFIPLGNLTVRNIFAVIPNYSKEKLLIDGEVQGEGYDFSRYFEKTSLKDSVGSALKQLQVSGNINSTIHLNIPFSHNKVEASGDVQLSNNYLYIKPLKGKLKKINGHFHYHNGTLNSDTIAASLFGQPVTLRFSIEEQEKAFIGKIELSGKWTPTQFSELPKPLQTELSGTADWRSHMVINLPRKGFETYRFTIDADLKNISTRLPKPLNKAKGTMLPLKMFAKGDLKGFTLSGSLGKTAKFGSQWLLRSDSLVLARAAWQQGAKTPPRLPEEAELILILPSLEGESYLWMFSALHGDFSLHKRSKSGIFFPEKMKLRTPILQVLGQEWHDVILSSRNTLQGVEIHAIGREINANLMIPKSGMKRADILYLYYNPQWKSGEESNPVALPDKKSLLNEHIQFKDWSTLQFSCDECWIAGKNLGQITVTLQPEKDKFRFSDGVIDAGKVKLTASGIWKENASGFFTALKGRFTGSTLEKNVEWFIINAPLRATTFDVEYELCWHGLPWTPKLSSLSGVLNTRIGKGDVVNIGAVQPRRLLRLVSFDTLLQKFRFDFSNIFRKGFYFDSILSTAWIKDGVLYTDDLLIDGLEADIAMTGSIDLTNRKITIEAVITPEISTTIGVATSFMINPVVGASAFAASKTLAPLWKKISLIRYQIHSRLERITFKKSLHEQQKIVAKEQL